MSSFLKTLFCISLLLTSAVKADIQSVIINEIHYDPDVRTELVEFVELHNVGTATVDLSGWYFSDGLSYTFPQGARLAANGYLVVVQDRTGAVNSVTVASKYGISPTLIFGPFIGRLKNDGEKIELCNSLGEKVDEVDYQLGFPWPMVGDSVPNGTAGRGSSIQLVNPALDNDLGGSWRSAYPTPGVKNAGIYAENIPPQIRQVSHSPKQPHSSEIVTITAKITDPDGVKRVTLHYQLVNPGSYIPITLPNYPSISPNETVPNPAFETSANWLSVLMHDDGLNGDVTAGDDTYTVQLPRSLQVHRRIVRYRITVEDNGGRSVRVPYEDDPQPNFAYFVYEGVPAWRGAIQPGSSDPQKAQVCTFSTELMTSLPVYHLIAREQDVINCQYNESYFNRENPQFYFSGTLVYDEEVYDNIHFRIRGTWSTFRWGKNKWKFDFNRGHWFQGRDDYGNEYIEKVDKFNLGNGTCPWWKYPHPDGNWDRGTGGMMLNEPLAYRLYNMAGVPASNTHFIHLRIIDHPLESEQNNQYEGDFWGLYFVVEQVDGNFLDERELPDGNIYRMEGSINQNHQCYTQVTNQSDVIAFITAFENNHPSKQWWSQNFDLSTFYSSKTIGVCINDSDRRVNYNCVYYHDSSTGQWLSFPWDLDLSFEVGGHYSEYDWEHFHFAIDDYSEYAIAYRNRARELGDLLLNADQAWQVIDEIACLIYDPIAPVSFIDAERARWDYAPYVSSSSKGLFYENNEFLEEKSFAGVLAYMKQFILPDGFVYPYGGPNLDQQARDADIPYTPTIHYTGEPEFPADALTFNTSSFRDPQGSSTFAGMKWRIAEVENPAGTEYNPREPHNYEIYAAWESDELSQFNSTIKIPVSAVKVGGTYRVRCRMKDNTGRWSHWSDPVQFVAGEPLSADSFL